MLKKFNSSALYACVCFCMLSLCLSCQKNNEDTNVLTLGKIIDNYLEQNIPDGSPGLSLIVKKEGTVLHKANVGMARLGDSHGIDNNTQFRVGSITKPITALAIMKLIEEGQLNLNDRLMDVLPGLPATYSEITIEHLLTHQSGLLDYIDDNNDLRSLHNLPTSAVIGILEGSGLENLQFAPGTSGDYSNTGYVLLALVIEEITGNSYPDHLSQVFFDPLGMTNSFVISENRHLADNGSNYAMSFGRTLEVKGFNSLIYGASGVASTTNDLMRFADAVIEGQIVSSQTLSLMTQFKGPLSEIADYGLGWMLGSGDYWHSGRYSDTNNFWHMGGFDGYRTVLSFNPDLDLQVVILTNNGQASQLQMLDLLELIHNYFK